MRDFFCRLGAELRRLRREEDGVIIACSLAVFLFLYVLGCGVYALGTTIYEREALQNAADAAAYSAASIQADALSRMAMLNKALSYTYIQMSRKQMDCITAQWLRLVYDRYNADKMWAEQWPSVIFLPQTTIPVDLITLLNAVKDFTTANVGELAIKKVSKCCMKDYQPFCGYGNTRDVVNVNGNPIPIMTIAGVLTQYDTDYVRTLSKSIQEDKNTIEALNALYSGIHSEMVESIELTVANVLQRNLRAAFGDVLDDVYYSLKTPEAEWNPYILFEGINGTSLDDKDAMASAEKAGYFQWLRNTENDERRFLAMTGKGTETWTLPTFFVSPKLQASRLSPSKGKLLGATDDSLRSSGFDQWFVRGRRTGERFLREDGGPGIRRVFWDTNTEERRRGLYGATRGNHMLGGNLSAGSGFVQQIIGQLSSALISLVDVGPSVGSRKGGPHLKDGEDPRACSHINEGAALYAEYEWASAKWFCIGVHKKKRKGFKWPRKEWRCSKWHIPIPKYFCGKPLNGGGWRMFESDNEIEAVIEIAKAFMDVTTGMLDGNASPTSRLGAHFRDMLGLLAIGNGDVSAYHRPDHHGYADREGEDFGTLLIETGKGVARQLKLNITEHEIPREDYRSCAIGAYPNNGGGSDPNDRVWLRGYARIYGDDAEILDPLIYEGANPRPWILSERFFGPDGTITVAVAKRRRNPWMQLLGDAVESVRSLYSVGNPAGKNEAAGTYMWALSSGRAAFRDPVDGSLQGSYRYLNKERQHDGLGDFEPGESGCVCDTAPARLERQWNLCVTEWEPTLVPVAMADAFRAVEDQFVANPQQETSGLAKLLYLDFVDDGTIQKDEGDESGWLPLSGEGDPKKTDEFLRVAAPGSGDGPTFGPENKADWPKTLWPRKIL